METITTIITSLAVSLPLLSILWIWRSTKKLGSPNGMFAVIIFAFTLWHFYAAAGQQIHNPTYEMITGLFILLTCSMNVFCNSYSKIDVNIGINRRKKQHAKYDSLVDRRIDCTTIKK